MNQREATNNSSDERSELVKWFSDLGKDSENLVGEKGANLSEIYNLKLPITPGFIVTTKAYDYFLENSPGLNNKIKGLLEKINYEDPILLNDIAEVIRNGIMEAHMPQILEEEILDAYDSLGAGDLSDIYGSALDILQNAQEPIFVAVRSSAPAGNNPKEGLVVQQDSFLNVKGESELITHIKKCFASLFTPNEIYARYKKGLKDSPIKLAVIVQKMVDSNKSGVIFSKNPNNLDENMIIQAIWGLGEGASSKIITPDEYVLNKNLEIIDIKVAKKEIAITRDSSGSRITIPLREEKSKQQVLTKRELTRLAKLSLEIEEHYKRPQCIEFAIEGEDIYLVQTREMKTNHSNKEIKIEEDIKREIKEPVEPEKIQEIKPVATKTKTKVKLIINSPSFVDRAIHTGIKSAGIIKIEDIILESGKHPKYYLTKNAVKEYEDIIFKELNKIAEHFNELWIRTSDIIGDEFPELEGTPNEKEANPRLGLHGIRFSLNNPEIFEAELNAFKRVSESGKEVGVIIPNLVQIDELQKVKEILDKINFKEVRIGVSIETPASVQLINQICDERINFISIDINSLTQNILSIDKRNKNVSYLYNELHPAILYQLSYIIRVAKKKGVKTSIILESEKKEELIPFLIKEGIDIICMKAEDTEKIVNCIKEVEENIIKGTDQEPRKYTPKENKSEETPVIKGIEKLHER